MPAITYQEFGGGLDRRLPVNVQDASRLWVLKNAHITLGKKIRKRPPIRSYTDGGAGTVGLAAINGLLTVFAESGGPPPVIGPTQYLTHPPTAVAPLTGISQVVLFQGYPYVVAEYGNQVFHHYCDGTTPTYVTDTNCPHTKGITIAASRIFAPSGENVRYCAAGDARDWTTASDAGFLPAGLQQNTKDAVTACGTFQDALVVLFSESAQVWDVAVDPSANKIRKRIYGVGTTEPLSVAAFANDLMFLSPSGFRSMFVQTNTDRIDDTDTGSPVDALVVPDYAAVLAEAGLSPSDEIYAVRGAWIPQLGQYWASFKYGATMKIWVYSYSRSSKLACWSFYETQALTEVGGIATLNGKVYIRSGDSIYEVKTAAIASEQIDLASISGFQPPIDVEVQMAFQDAKTPGVLKQFNAADFVLQGEWEVSYKYDPRDQTKETIPQSISGDTRPGDLIPVEVSAPALAPVFRHSANEEAEIDAITLYYETLGLMG